VKRFRGGLVASLYSRLESNKEEERGGIPLFEQRRLAHHLPHSGVQKDFVNTPWIVHFCMDYSLTEAHCTCGLTPPYSGRDCVKSHRMGLYPQSVDSISGWSIGPYVGRRDEEAGSSSSNRLATWVRPASKVDTRKFI